MAPGVFSIEDLYASCHWKQVKHVEDLEFLPLLQNRQEWLQPKWNVNVGDIVLIVDNSAPRNSWLIGRILATMPDKRGFIRKVLVKTKIPTLGIPISKLCLLIEADKGYMVLLS